MSQEIELQLNTNSLLNVPLNSYTNDFVFIVNGEEFKTNKFVSDLLSKKICHLHQVDPTADTFSIDTKSQGNFLNILKLANFEKVKISKNKEKEYKEEISFLREILNILEPDTNSLSINFPTLTEENVISLLQEEISQGFQLSQMAEIAFVSSHFYHLCETHNEQLKNLPIEILYSILNHESLQLTDEDQLLKFVNSIYEKSSKKDEESRYNSSILYETVYFLNASNQIIEEFIQEFNVNDINNAVWRSLCQRLVNGKSDKINRYKRSPFQKIEPGPNNQFNGIIKFLKDQNKGNIKKHLHITSSSSSLGSIWDLTAYDNIDAYFMTNKRENSWICFDFIDNKIIPSNYQIRSRNSNAAAHPKSWVVEGSNDNSNWENLDTQTDCSFLNGASITHIFDVNNPQSKEFRYIRIRQTSQNCYDSYYFLIGAFEIYGKLITKSSSEKLVN